MDKSKLSILFIFFVLFSIVFANSPTAESSVTFSVQDLYPNVSIEPSPILIKIRPNSSDRYSIVARSLIGNLPINVSFELLGNVTNISFIYPTELSLDVLEAKSIGFYISTENISVSNYTGELHSIINETGVENSTPIFIEVSENVGRFHIHVVDEANRSLEGAFVQVYQGVNFVEQGYTDGNGMYITHYYDMDLYYAFLVMREGYTSTTRGKRLTEPEMYFEIVMGGTPQLNFNPSNVTISMYINQTRNKTLTLENIGTGKEKWIEIISDTSWLVPNVREIEYIEPGGYREITVNIGPFSQSGTYTSRLRAFGYKSSAIAYFTIDVRLLPFCGDGVCGGNETCENCPEDCGPCPPPPPLPPGPPGPGGGAPTQPTQPGAGVTPGAGAGGAPGAGAGGIGAGGAYPWEQITRFPRLDVSYPREITLTKLVPKLVFIYIKNVGEIPITNMALYTNATNISIEIHPIMYSILFINETRIFLLKLLASEITQGNIILKIDSGEIETYNVIKFNVISSEVDPEALLREIDSIINVLRKANEEVEELAKEGYTVAPAVSLINAIESKLLKARDAVRAKAYYEAKARIDDSLRDIDDLYMMISKIREQGPAKPAGINWWLILLLIILLILILILIIKRRKKKEEVEEVKIPKKKAEKK
ncbi:MAG: hypothetical protein OH354_01475 [Candidatus Parvarchaeota archaeon]|nr:hypothetical protein [Candidatus Jingweiarchaeum tengchongense]MCW1300075.1 hypothetical protein [Candidatus Jingweiarchaeum tengchongense]MCW1304429.1 hypothetical protein [Candidatus Jingweiarchaeum tengchongense]MCW1305596.1 hypothetical protein [Candidatus Jingweiarchaeum tengchongense]MCW1310977.1 hypothetical protein [Candidatus Jingweiarchaeum tengchongense]